MAPLLLLLLLTVASSHWLFEPVLRGAEGLLQLTLLPWLLLGGLLWLLAGRD